MRKQLKKARIEAGYTQQALAEVLGISTRHYQRIENGVSDGTFKVWDTLEDITGVHQRVLREILSTHHGQEDNR